MMRFPKRDIILRCDQFLTNLGQLLKTVRMLMKKIWRHDAIYFLMRVRVGCLAISVVYIF